MKEDATLISRGCVILVERRKKPVTKDLIRKYFGKNAKITGFCGHYCVKTAAGGEVEISDRKVKLVYGGDDVYRSMTLLIGACWETARAGHGSREFMLGAVAHGEAWGVNIQPDFRNRWAAFGRICVAVFVFFIGIQMLPEHADGTDLLIVLLLPPVTFWLMKRSAKREEQRRLETSGFIFPQQARGAEYADDDQLRKGGLI